jgi:hypothetical protein
MRPARPLCRPGSGSDALEVLTAAADRFEALVERRGFCGRSRELSEDALFVLSPHGGKVGAVGERWAVGEPAVGPWGGGHAGRFGVVQTPRVRMAMPCSWMPATISGRERSWWTS